MATISYLHPHIETNIYDNSEVYVSTESNGSVLFQPYFSERGISGEIERFTDLGEFLKLKGIPNYRKYGQSQYNIVQWLQGGGTVYGIRLTDQLASYSNLILKVQVAVDADGKPIKLDIDSTNKKKIITRLDITDYNELKEKTEGVSGEITEWTDEGYSTLVHSAHEHTAYETDKLCVGTNVNSKNQYLKISSVSVTTNDPEEEGGEPTTTETQTLVTSTDNLTDEGTYVFDTVEDPDQATEFRWVDFYLFLIRTKGKGSFGNRNAIRFTQNNAANKSYDFTCYNLTVVENKENGTIRNSEGPIPFSFYPDAMTAGGSNLSLKQIVIDYYMQIACYYDEDEYSRLVDLIMEATGGIGNAYKTEGKIDFIFGDDYVTVYKTERGSQITSSTGAFLTGGGDGNFVGPYNKLNIEGNDNADNAMERGVVKEIVTQFFNASSGIAAEAEIYNKKKYPFDVVLDFNLPDAAKTALTNFASTRGDCIVCLDTGEQATPAKTVDYRKEKLSVNDYLASVWSQMFTVYDSYTSSDIYVTPTYFLASKIPYSDNNYGIQYPFVGPNRGIITGFKRLNWTPNDQQKENLYDVQVNYIEQDNRVTKFMSQLTAQDKTTSLSDINHVRCLLRIVRSVEDLMENYIFELGTENTIATINSALDAVLSEWVNNGTCTTCTGNCSQTVIEAENKTAHVTLTVVFVDVIEKIVIDVNVTR